MSPRQNAAPSIVMTGPSGPCRRSQSDRKSCEKNAAVCAGCISKRAGLRHEEGRTTLKTFSESHWRLLALGAFGLIGAAQAQDKGTVGVAMPTKSSARWIDDGNNMVKVAEGQGLQVDLQYAEDDIPNQLAQIENMITKGAKVLVIAAIDGTTLSDALQQAADKGIKVIAYDRLIRNSKNVDYYATFDNFQVGVLQGGYIEKALGLKEGKGPFNIELFGGSPDDNNAFFFYNGAMSVLDPYIKSGKLVVRSSQTGMDKVSTLRWDGAVAQARMDNLLSRLLHRQARRCGSVAL